MSPRVTYVYDAPSGLLRARGRPDEPYTPTPGGGTPPAANGLVWDRSWYPGPGSQNPLVGTPEFDALGDWRTWPKAYWLPTGSTYPVPSDVFAFYGSSPHFSTIAGKKLRIKCPVIFEDPLGANVIENGSGIIRGLRMRHNTWKVNTPLTNPDGSVKAMAYGKNTSAQEVSLDNALFFRWKGGGNNSLGNFRALEQSGVLPGPDGYLKIMELIDYDGKTDRNDTFITQNVRGANADTTQGLSHVIFGAAGDHYQGDIEQPIQGPTVRARLGLVGVSSYQGVFDQSRRPGSFHHSERVWLRGDQATHGGQGGNAYLWWDASRTDASITRTWGTGNDGVYVEPTNGSRSTLFGWDGAGTVPSAYDGIVIGPAPRDFVPLSSIETIDLTDDPDGDAWDF